MKYKINDRVIVRDSPHQDLNGQVAQVAEITQQGDSQDESFYLYRLRFYLDPELRFSCVERYLKPFDYLEEFKKGVKFEDMKIS